MKNWKLFGLIDKTQNIEILSMWRASILRIVLFPWILLRSLINRITIKILGNINAISRQNTFLICLLCSIASIGLLNILCILRIKIFTVCQKIKNLDCWEFAMYSIFYIGDLRSWWFNWMFRRIYSTLETFLLLWFDWRSKNVWSDFFQWKNLVSCCWFSTVWIGFWCM